VSPAGAFTAGRRQWGVRAFDGPSSSGVHIGACWRLTLAGFISASHADYE
jgi:hypothetical protein